MDGDWRVDLERWLEPYLKDLGHKARQRMCPAYVAGLIGPGDRKSIQPMAARTDEVGYDRLHHFIGAGLWVRISQKRDRRFTNSGTVVSLIPGQREVVFRLPG